MELYQCKNGLFLLMLVSSEGIHVGVMGNLVIQDALSLCLTVLNSTVSALRLTPCGLQIHLV